MWPVIGGLISGAMGLFGSVKSADTSAQNTQANIAMQRETNMLNVQEAQKNRDFQEQMSSTAYQRSSQDMQAAGLNPAMMFGSGSAASTPGGAVATNVAPRSEKRSPWEGLGRAAEQAVSTAINIKQQEKMTDEIANLFTQRKQMEASTNLTRQQELTEWERTRLNRWLADREQLGLSGAKLESMSADELIGLARKHPEIFKDVLGADWLSKHTRSATDQIGSMVGSAIGLKRQRALEAEGKRRYEQDRADRRSGSKSESTTEYFEGGSRTFNERFPQ